ncbi:MAG: RluA family pseudouridine synthase [Acidobacteria bacterium]|nr:RluA family pseudouridine synthase [Acidobacteriota bacterium]
MEFRVTPEEQGLRLDHFLARKMPDWTRSQVQRLIRDEQVRVAGRAPQKAGQKLDSDQSVTVEPFLDALDAYPEDLPLEILYDDDDLAVINKPAGVVVHAGAGVKSGTLVNALLYHLGQTGKLSKTSDPIRPGIVHRLDKMTSGVMLVAKTDAAHRKLAEQFKARAVGKCYRALVHGKISERKGEIALPVGRDRHKRVRMRVGGIAARDAVTPFEVLRRYEGFTLLRARPKTGRTHQIRVHFAARGRPVVGDTLYGAPARITIGGRPRATLERHFLHAEEIRFRHPTNGEPMCFRSPLPPELEEFLKKLEAASGSGGNSTVETA